jgi:hypothetical protein
MCMSSVTTKVKRIRPRTGYKYFPESNSGGGYVRNYMDFKIGKWYMCEDPTTTIEMFPGTYPAGFHLFNNKQVALKRNRGGDLYKIEYLNVVAEGIDCGQKTIIAQMIKVLEKVE